MCFNIECIYLALWQIKCCCSFTCKRWREINLDRYISILRRNIEYIPSEYCHQKQQANMETFTIHDMLINSTDIYQILCGLGIGNLSECKNDNNATSEPKGKDNLTFYCLLFYFTLFYAHIKHWKKTKKKSYLTFTNKQVRTGHWEHRLAADLASYPVFIFVLPSQCAKVIIADCGIP